MMRLHDWQLRLEAFARERRGAPFAWGSNDCATFAAAAVEALTGERLLPELRGLPVREALQTMRRMGGMSGIASSVLGPSVAPAFARIGDVVLVQVGKREALAVCNGTSAIGPGPAGLAAVSMKNARAAWMVG